MQHTDEAAELGMRDRKKARTRESIRTAAFDLFEDQGFEQTTVQQICRRADVAHRTFFRYYPTKEALLFGWDFGQVVLDAFAAAPAALDPWAALDHALATTDGQWEEPVEHTARRRRLRREHLDVQSVRNYALIVIDSFTQRTVEATAQRMGVDPVADLRPAAFAAMFTGIVRRHVLIGSDGNPIAAWVAAYRQVLGAPEPTA
ncbi:TetR/AcrR family transcriptional regulator [Streptomyces sp. FH025]|uniref:TetR/AcrR family transcriptional regulator n=1 Tax=Streptomyces sp. FH025 TaxID=2815937 RepID=UPI001A9E67D8|nr:TetR/AcrR family transcriptional regulator [Streptomyces sp. FH025]MBO1419867.1 TetR family transcriptional regulator [Streptomyces sp. FH025]